MGTIVCKKCDEQFRIISKEDVLDEEEMGYRIPEPKIFVLKCPKCEFHVTFQGSSDEIDNLELNQEI